MAPDRIDITFLWHDCFLVQTPQCALVFDYWRDPLAAPGEPPLFLSDLPQETPLYVVVSHHHKDHYTKEIFSWEERHPAIRYVLSRDVARFARHILNPAAKGYAGPRPTPDKVTVLSPGQSWSDDLVAIQAFGSTDIGNSYIIRTAGQTLFHAGDLNAWGWVDESSEAEVKKAVADFEKILGDIAEATGRFDTAFFPVDSRIGTDYYLGASIFVRRFAVDRFIPMHFCLGTTPEESIRYRTDAARFARYANPDRGEYIALQAPYAAYSYAGTISDR